MSALLFLFFGCACSTYAESTKVESKIIHIKVIYKEAKINDTLVLLVAPKYLQNFEGINLKQIKAIANEHGIFDFEAKTTSEFGYWQLFKRNELDPNNRSLQVYHNLSFGKMVMTLY